MEKYEAEHGPELPWESLEVDSAKHNLPGPQCRVALLYAHLNLTGQPNAVASIQRTLSNPRLTTSSIQRALSARLPDGDAPSVQSLVRHRRGDCACPRGTS